MELNKLAASLHPLERKVLPLLAKYSTSEQLVEHSGLKEVEVMRALQWLENRKLIVLKVELQEVVELQENGKLYAAKGLPERLFVEAIRDRPSRLAEIQSKARLDAQELSASLGVLKQKAAIEISNGLIALTEAGRKLASKETLEEKFLKRLSQGPLEIQKLTDEERFALENLRKRKSILGVAVKKIRSITFTEHGKKLAALPPETRTIDKLTPQLLKSQQWKGKQFRRYDVSINVPKVYGGRSHFVNQAIQYIRRIWLDLGFKEMEGNLVQTSFWDLDALFVPQDHPARDLQDTFYIKEPRYGTLPQKFVKVVKATHEDGWTTGSKGWGYKWSEDIAKENLLRTHTTVLSARTIASLKRQDLPQKFFSVKRVFRNEALSWKSLFEFVQVEGIVVDPDANFKHLKGYLKTFFSKMGFEGVRIRPGHFPYTEPSAEVDVWHPEKKRWVELGGSGLFRPEVTKPLIGEEVPVLAWGLGMERSIMEYYKMTDIRDIYKNDLKQLREIKLWMR
jgi:phenylalanyl-tRNA synthetase alpha chain